MAVITILIARIAALYEKDVKKIIAYSTLSQLGVMGIGLGIRLENLAFNHLLVHAFFKALLFICAGDIIHLRNFYQNINKIRVSPLTSNILRSRVVLRRAGLSALPFISSYYSKEIILETSLSQSFSLGE